MSDSEDYLHAGLRPLACRSCETTVLVKKTSRAHTSIQWTGDPAASCPEFAAHVTGGKSTAQLDGCRKLAGSIAQAVREGAIEVADG
ncbi:MAG: hypothetical protein ACRDRN_09485 [Sciscionella sp.]